MQQLKDTPTDFSTLILNAPDGALIEFLSIVKGADRTETTIKIIDIITKLKEEKE